MQGCIGPNERNDSLPATPACSLVTVPAAAGIRASMSPPKSFSITAQPETLKTVQSTIAKKLSIELNSVTPGTKFVDLGADSLDTVEIMMALEEQFEISIGEDGAQNIATVQDAADLIEKVKAGTA
ncbi:hypothetical protein Dsin_017999 [Dipteronia sinensis]|uniref:Acyl carrier protein n=1 Tax=Dipteronia sinensis TaxID=43782 RepID=A0AAE0E8F8_9ROSI|nr:hypothetical protein Dsin_017999 [Dipteronia sinensis]